MLAAARSAISAHIDSGPGDKGRNRRDVLLRCERCGATVTGRTHRSNLTFNPIGDVPVSDEAVAATRRAWLVAENAARGNVDRLAEANRLRTAYREALDGARKSDILAHRGCGGRFHAHDIHRRRGT